MRSVTRGSKISRPARGNSLAAEARKLDIAAPAASRTSPSPMKDAPPEVASTIGYHEQHPEVSVHAHILAKSRERAALVNARKALYLDTKFWIKLRDASLGLPFEPADAESLAEICGAVASGRLVCPVATDIVAELTNIGDMAKRAAAARLVDELSLGITLRMETERLGVELEDFLRRPGGKKRATARIRDEMWTCPGYAFGLTVPTHPGIDPALQLAIQKAFVDHLYTLRYATQDRMVGQVPVGLRDFSALAEGLNRLNGENAAAAKSFEGLLSNEFRGALDVSMDAIARALKENAQEHFGRLATAAEAEDAKKLAPKLAEVIARLFEEGRIAANVPTLVIRAYLHAAVRWDKTRQYKNNDFHDFSHAVAALPYFDLFATERSLAHLVSSQLKLDQRYGCVVVKTSAELLAAVRGIGAKPA